MASARTQPVPWTENRAVVVITTAAAIATILTFLRGAWSDVPRLPSAAIESTTAAARKELTDADVAGRAGGFAVTFERPRAGDQVDQFVDVVIDRIGRRPATA